MNVRVDYIYIQYIYINIKGEKKGKKRKNFDVFIEGIGESAGPVSAYSLTCVYELDTGMNHNY
jgi:hypothetical protein